LTKGRDTLFCYDITPLVFTESVKKAIIDQTMIGWIHATKGFLAKTWTEVASLSYDASGRLICRPVMATIEYAR
jgi:hypothetical protein